MRNTTFDFDAAFSALTGYAPLRWQRRLFFERFMRHDIPSSCDLPTGIGKTSVIPIWLLSLASEARDEAPLALPRRLAYVVNRRTVVDQATEMAEDIRRRLLCPNHPSWSEHAGALLAIRDALTRLPTTDGPVLAISTLRGELADNQEWKVDPARAAIIVGTIDMIGSKLLFSGYGDGRYWRAQHAGLLGQDTLVVHDEAHLTPAFGRVLRDLADIQTRAEERRPVQIMELTATARSGAADFSLEPEDDEDDVVQRRIDAKKSLRLCRSHQGELVDRLVALSTAHADNALKVLVYVRSPETAKKVFRGLAKAVGKDRVALLSGTLRGYERDSLIHNNPYRAFAQPDERVESTVYLVATSAGEVGVDLDADHMICDSTTLDSLVQRLGRVNRRGSGAAVVDLVLDGGDGSNSSSAFAGAIQATEEVLEGWISRDDGEIDVGPRSLRRLIDDLDVGQRHQALSPTPAIVPVTEILLDAWSLTSINEAVPGRRGVAAFLHGLEAEPPESFVAWRKEIALLDDAAVPRAELETWFQVFPVETHERLRDRTERIRRELDKLLKAHRKKSGPTFDLPVVVLTERGRASMERLSAVVEKRFRLDFRTIVLPAKAGGLNEGILDSAVTVEAEDVADVRARRRPRERCLLHVEPDGPRYERLLDAQAPTGVLKELLRITLEEPVEETSEGGTYLVAALDPQRAALEQPELVRTRQILESHLRLTAQHAERLASALGLEAQLADAIVAAASRHDTGKHRPVWQWYACNATPEVPLAKSQRYRHPRLLGGYRHELGSVLDALGDEDLDEHPERDLILHLIAAHHGWARPHFADVASDITRTTSENGEAIFGAIQRFGRLQHRFGRWGLAWLEALVRSADAAASQEDLPAGMREEEVVAT